MGAREAPGQQVDYGEGESAANDTYHTPGGEVGENEAEELGSCPVVGEGGNRRHCGGRVLRARLVIEEDAAASSIQRPMPVKL